MAETFSVPRRRTPTIEDVPHPYEPLGADQTEAFRVPKRAEPSLERASVLGQEFDIPEPMREAVTNAHDFFASFNSALTNVVGAPVGAVDEVMKMLGSSGFLDDPGDAVEGVKGAFRKLGISVDPKRLGDFASELGKNTFANAIGLGVLFKMAPTLAAMTPKGTTGNIMKSIGTGLQTHPGTAIASEFTATVGQTAAGQIDPRLEPVGALVGSGAGALGTAGMVGKTVGGVTGGATGTVAGTAAIPVAGWAAQPAGAISGAILGKNVGGKIAQRVMRGVLPPATLPREPGTVGKAAKELVTGHPIEAARTFAKKPAPALIDKTVPMEATTFAREALEGDRMRVANTVQRTIAVSEADPAKASERLHEGLEKAYRSAQKTASKLWKKVDMGQPARGDKIKNYVNTIVLDTAESAREDNLPHHIIDLVGKLGDETTLKELQGLRSVITAELRKPEPNDTLRMNLNRIHDAVLNSMVKANPTDKALVTAREYSKWLHDNFSRGPVGAFLGRGKSAGAQQMRGPTEAAKAFVSREKAGPQVAAIQERLGMPELEKQASSYIKNEFQRIADEDPSKGLKWLNTPQVQRFMAKFPTAKAKIDDISHTLGGALKEQGLIEKSAFKRFAGEDIQTATRQLFDGPHKVQTAKELTDRLLEDPRAYKGFKNQVLAEFFTRTGWDFKKMDNLLNTKDMRGLMTTVLRNDMPRLNRMIATATKLTPGPIGRAKNKIFNPVTTLFSWAAGKASKTFGATTIQQTGTGATIGRAVGESLTAKTPVEELFVRAITDAKVERIMYSRLPSNLVEMGRTEDLLRTVSAGIATANEALGD